MNKETTVRAPDTAPAITLPAVDCAPWCRDGHGHTDAFHPDDQACMSETQSVDLTAMPRVMWQGKVEGRDNLRAYILRERDARSATVELCHDDNSVASLTFDEVLEVAHILRTLVSIARGADKG
jgi:hypothetical protein